MRGITVTLWEKELVGKDDFNKPIYKETAVPVENVLVSPTSAEENVDVLNLYGRMAAYTLAIPKGDDHEWENRKVTFFGEDWKVFGIPQKGIDALVPTAWNMKVTVERYE